MSEFLDPIARNEAILQNMLGAENELLPPMSRIEALLLALLEEWKTIAENGVGIDIRWSTAAELDPVIVASKSFDDLYAAIDIASSAGAIDGAIPVVRLLKQDNGLLYQYVPTEIVAENDAIEITGYRVDDAAISVEIRWDGTDIIITES